MLTAVETTGTIDSNHQIVLDELLPDDTPSRVRVIVLFDDNHDIPEKEWMRSASRNETFDFLSDETEDIYSLADGKPLPDEK